MHERSPDSKVDPRTAHAIYNFTKLSHAISKHEAALGEGAGREISLRNVSLPVPRGLILLAGDKKELAGGEFGRADISVKRSDSDQLSIKLGKVLSALGEPLPQPGLILRTQSGEDVVIAEPGQFEGFRLDTDSTGNESLYGVAGDSERLLIVGGDAGNDESVAGLFAVAVLSTLHSRANN